jgi:malonyl CoA-acyl carrier protein transacylase
MAQDAAHAAAALDELISTAGSILDEVQQSSAGAGVAERLEALHERHASTIARAAIALGADASSAGGELAALQRERAQLGQEIVAQKAVLHEQIALLRQLLSDTALMSVNGGTT